MLRLVDWHPGELVAQHLEIIADGGFDFLARPIVAGHASALNVVLETPTPAPPR